MRFLSPTTARPSVALALALPPAVLPRVADGVPVATDIFTTMTPDFPAASAMEHTVTLSPGLFREAAVSAAEILNIAHAPTWETESSENQLPEPKRLVRQITELARQMLVPGGKPRADAFTRYTRRLALLKSPLPEPETWELRRFFMETLPQHIKHAGACHDHDYLNGVLAVTKDMGAILTPQERDFIRALAWAAIYRKDYYHWFGAVAKPAESAALDDDQRLEILSYLVGRILDEKIFPNDTSWSIADDIRKYLSRHPDREHFTERLRPHLKRIEAMFASTYRDFRIAGLRMAASISAGLDDETARRWSDRILESLSPATAEGIGIFFKEACSALVNRDFRKRLFTRAGEASLASRKIVSETLMRTAFKATEDAAERRDLLDDFRGWLTSQDYNNTRGALYIYDEFNAADLGYLFADDVQKALANGETTQFPLGQMSDIIAYSASGDHSRVGLLALPDGRSVDWIEDVLLQDLATDPDARVRDKLACFLPLSRVMRAFKRSRAMRVVLEAAQSRVDSNPSGIQEETLCAFLSALDNLQGEPDDEYRRLAELRREAGRFALRFQHDSDFNVRIKVATLLFSVALAFDDADERFAALNFACDVRANRFLQADGITRVKTIADPEKRLQLFQRIAGNSPQLWLNFADAVFPEIEYRLQIAREKFGDIVLRGGPQGISFLKPLIPILARDGSSRGFFTPDMFDNFIRYSPEAAAAWSLWSQHRIFYGSIDNVKTVAAFFHKVDEMIHGNPYGPDGATLLADYLSSLCAAVEPTANRFRNLMPLLTALQSYSGAIPGFEEFLRDAPRRIASYAVDENGRQRSRRDIHVLEDELKLVLDIQYRHLTSVLKSIPEGKSAAEKILDPQRDAAGQKVFDALNTSGLMTHLLMASTFLNDTGKRQLARLFTLLYADAASGNTTRYDELMGEISPELIRVWREDGVMNVAASETDGDDGGFLATMLAQMCDHNQPTGTIDNTNISQLPARITVLIARLADKTGATPELRTEIESLAETFRVYNSFIRDAFGDRFAELHNDLGILHTGLNAVSDHRRIGAELYVGGKPIDFALSAISPMLTCQRLIADTGHNNNGEPLTRMLHGRFKIAFWRAGDEPSARALIEITRDALGPALLVERFYMAGGFTRLGDFRRSLCDYAATLSIPVNRVFFSESAHVAPRVLPLDEPMYRDTFEK